jgi:hypothetical protein
MRRISSGFIGFSDANREMAVPARPTPFHNMGAETPPHAFMRRGIWKRIREPAAILTRSNP